MRAIIMLSMIVRPTLIVTCAKKPSNQLTRRKSSAPPLRHTFRVMHANPLGTSGARKACTMGKLIICGRKHGKDRYQFHKSMRPLVSTGLDMYKVSTEAVPFGALCTRTLTQVWTSVKYVRKQSLRSIFNKNGITGLDSVKYRGGPT